MLTRGLTRVLLVLVAVCAGPKSLWSRSQSPGVSSDEHVLFARSSNCFGQRLDVIRFPGLSSADQQMLSRLSGLHPGETLEREKLQEAERALFATGRFRLFEVDCEPSAQGQVVLTFPSSPNYFVGAITVEGAPSRPTQSQLVNASKLQLGELLTTEKMETAQENIRRLMRENGFYRALVDHSEVYNSEIHQVEITFRIHPGDPAHIGLVMVTGNTLFSRGQIEDVAHLHPGDTVTAQTTSTAIDKIRKKYQQQDHWLVQVTIQSAQYQEKINAVDYTLVLVEGPLVEIRVEGFRMGKSTIRRNIPVYEENALDDDLLNEGTRNL
ncbi:MAG: hypothetical protein JO356_21530, partial [Acidobacteria bacterium]|nr:hypothetical protein [Acidobacteriota bacterium]